MEKLWTAGRIGPMETKNRTIRSATNEHLATREGGELTPAWMDACVDLAKGGVGTIITGHFSVDKTQRADEGQALLCADMDAGMFERSCEILRQTVQQVHACGAKLVIQISHSGPKAPADFNDRPPKYPADFTLAEYEKLVKDFAFTAKTCRACGVDGVQVHMAHGYFLSSVLSPELNTRTDAYGGSLENRFRLCSEIIRAVKEVCADKMALLVKVDSNCCGDLPALLRMCEAEQVDCAEVSGLDFGTHKRDEGPFYLDAVAEAIKEIKMPVALVGGIASLEDARKVMDAGIEFASFARALLCEPDLIGKLERGVQTKAACIGCSGCFQVYRKKPRRCVLHTTDIPQLAETFGPYSEK